MDDFERTLRSILAGQADSVSGSDELPAATARRGRIRRTAIALTASLSVLIAGVGAYASVAALRDDRIPDVRVVNPPQPSSTEEPQATPSVNSPAPGDTPALPAAVRRTMPGRAIAGLVTAHGSMWATDIEEGAGKATSLLYRIGDDGTPTTTIRLNRYLQGAYVFLRPVADDGGIWLLIDATVTERTAAAGRCAALQRTGPDRVGGEVLLRLDGRTNCPTHLIEAGPTQAEIDSAGGDGTTRQTVRGMAFSGGAVWLATEYGLRKIDPASSSITAIDDRVYQAFAAGFGSLWAAVPRNDRNESVLRLSASDGLVEARIESDLVVISFGFGAGSVWAATESTGRPIGGAFPNDQNGAVMQIDPQSNRIVRETGNIGGPDAGTGLTIADGRVYACHVISVVRLSAKGSGRDRLILRYGDRPRYISACQAEAGVLWVAIQEFGLYRVDVAQAQWERE